MPATATGELRKLASGYEARIRISGKVRKGFLLVAVGSDEVQAKQRCLAMAEIAVRLRRAGHVAQTEELLRMAASARGERPWQAIVSAVETLCGGGAVPVSAKAPETTFGELATQWTSGKLHAKYPDHVESKRTSEQDAQRLAKWVYPLVEHVPLASVTIAHAQEILRRIPADKSRATRRHVAQLMTRVLTLAVYPCELLPRSPLPRGFLPRIGKGKALTYLYPDEERKLLACAGTEQTPGIPMVERLFYGFLSREGLRSEEAQSLTWGHVDLKRGSVRVDVNKTDDPRTWALDPSVVRALQWWKDQHPDDGHARQADWGDVCASAHGRPISERDLKSEGTLVHGDTRSYSQGQKRHRRPAIGGRSSQPTCTGSPESDGSCSEGRKRCGELCVSALDPAYGCPTAACTPCSIPRGVAVCSQGACGIGNCEPGRANCNGNARRTAAKLPPRAAREIVAVAATRAREIWSAPTRRARRRAPELAGILRKVSAGEFHTCGVRADGTLACWGTTPTGSRTRPRAPSNEIARRSSIGRAASADAPPREPRSPSIADRRAIRLRSPKIVRPLARRSQTPRCPSAVRSRVDLRRALHNRAQFDFEAGQFVPNHWQVGVR